LASKPTGLPGAFSALRRTSNYARFLLGFGSGWRSLDAETRAAASLLRGCSRPVILDGGAHAGDWTDRLAQRLGTSCQPRWILVEPSPDFAARLRTRHPAATVLAVALGDEDREVVFFEAGAVGSLYRFDDGPSREIRVPLERLEGVIAKLGLERIDFLKLDLEGAELAALRGLGSYLRPDFVRALSFEFGVNNLRSRTCLHDFWTLLETRGYRIALITPRGTLAPLARYATDLEWFHGVTNFVACAPELARRPSR